VARLPRVEDRCDVGELRAAARLAGAEDLIDTLPDGWDTMLSRRYPGGAELSGGQWQRLALARALLAVQRGAQVLVLDEPTAQLDVRAEAELYERLPGITSSITTVLISHRFSTVRSVPRICVLSGGRITEQGTHAELLDLGGRYARMFRMQAERFAGERHA
jgi:ATP-binding cassette, subfamily B, bacterial